MTKRLVDLVIAKMKRKKTMPARKIPSQHDTIQADILKEQGFIPAPAVARAVGRHISSVYRWVQAGHVRGTQVGRSWYIEKASLVAWLGDDAKKFFPDLVKG